MTRTAVSHGHRRRGRLWRALVVAAVMATVMLCGAGIGGADPADPSAPPSAPPPSSAPATPGTPAVPIPAPAPGGSDPAVPQDDTGGTGDSDCGMFHVKECVSEAFTSLFSQAVKSALNPLLGFLSHTLLATPDPSELPRVGELWNSSWQKVLAGYGLVVTVAGVLLMLRETLQTRWGIRELAPRLVVGFIAGAASMTIATQAVRFANALAVALAGSGVEADSAGAALRDLTTAAIGSGRPDVFAIMLGLALAVCVTMLLVAYVVRVAVTIVLIVAAPLALMCHALPFSEPIARWWWRAFGACLAIQVVQSLVLITSLRVFLSPGGWSFFGPNKTGLVNLIVALALVGILIKVPFWLMSAMRIGHGRSLPATIVKSVVMYKTLGLLRGTGKAANPPASRASLGAARVGGVAAAKSADPYSKVRIDKDGQQYMLPLDGVRKVRPNPPSPGGQPKTSARPAAAAGTGGAARRKPAGRQLAFDFRPPDPHKGARAGRGGQYAMPLNVTRVPKPPAPPQAPARRGRPRGRQLAFDFDPDPYKGIRPGRGGQYPLPFEARRVRSPSSTPPTVAPPTVSPPPEPPRPPRPARPSGRQLRLPIPPTRRPRPTTS